MCVEAISDKPTDVVAGNTSPHDAPILTAKAMVR